MSSLIFDWTDCDIAANDGWLARGYPNFYASTGRGIAHDCVDHFPRGQKHGPYADELLALGARLWIWIESGEFFRLQGISYTTPAKTWGGELQIIVDDSEGLTDHPPAMIEEPMLDDALDSEIECILDELIHRRGPSTSVWEVDGPQIQNLGAWLRRGVRAARARYKGHQAFDVFQLYQRVTSACERIGSGEEGDKLIVRIHEKRLDVSVRLVSWRNQYE